jgi:hypothetical protein
MRAEDQGRLGAGPDVQLPPGLRDAHPGRLGGEQPLADQLIDDVGDIRRPDLEGVGDLFEEPLPLDGPVHDGGDPEGHQLLERGAVAPQDGLGDGATGVVGQADDATVDGGGGGGHDCSFTYSLMLVRVFRRPDREVRRAGPPVPG